MMPAKSLFPFRTSQIKIIEVHTARLRSKTKKNYFVLEFNNNYGNYLVPKTNTYALTNVGKAKLTSLTIRKILKSSMKHASLTVKQESRDPEVVTDHDSFARSDLIFPLKIIHFRFRFTKTSGFYGCNHDFS